MFDPEKAVATWREQMLAAGIKSPVPLHELEVHLREEIEKLQQSGLDTTTAFDAAVQNIGQPAALEKEFKKIDGRTLTTDRALGLLWFIYCAGSFFTLTSAIVVTLPSAGRGSLLHFQFSIPFLLSMLMNTIAYTRGIVASILLFNSHAVFLVAVLMDVIYLRGLIASVLLFGGHARERRFIFFLAALDAVGGVVVLSKSFHILPFIFTIVGIITLIAYWPRLKIQHTVE